MSKEKTTKAGKPAASTRAPKRPASRPPKKAASKAPNYQPKTRVTVTGVNATGENQIRAKATADAKETPSGKVALDARRKAIAPKKKPTVDVAQIEKARADAVAAKAESDRQLAVKEIELEEAKAKERRLNRTIKRLYEEIADYESKSKKFSRIRRFFGGRS